MHQFLESLVSFVFFCLFVFEEFYFFEERMIFDRNLGMGGLVNAGEGIFGFTISIRIRIKLL